MPPEEAPRLAVWSAPPPLAGGRTRLAVSAPGEGKIGLLRLPLRVSFGISVWAVVDGRMVNESELIYDGARFLEFERSLELWMHNKTDEAITAVFRGEAITVDRRWWRLWQEGVEVMGRALGTYLATEVTARATETGRSSRSGTTTARSTGGTARPRLRALGSN